MSGAVPLLPKFQFSNNGAPMSGGTVTVYLAGTVTPSNTWQDEALTILNTNPIVLDARGEAVIYLNPVLSYKFLLKNAAGVMQWTQDDIKGGGTAAEITAGLATLRADLAAPSGASQVGTINPTANAVATTQDKKNSERLSLLDFLQPAERLAVTSGSYGPITSVHASVQLGLNSGKALFIPPNANFKITTGLVVTGNAIDIRGGGVTSTITAYGAINALSIGDGVGTVNLGYVGNFLIQAADITVLRGIYGRNCREVDFDKVRIFGVNDTNRSFAQAAFELLFSWRCDISSCYALYIAGDGFRLGGASVGGTESNAITISGNTKVNRCNGIGYRSYGASHNYQGASAEACKNGGLVSMYCPGLSIAGGYFESNGENVGYSIRVASGQNGGSIGGVYIASTQINHRAIDLEALNGLTLSGNNFSYLNASAFGVYFNAGVSDVSLLNNKIEGGSATLYGGPGYATGASLEVTAAGVALGAGSTKILQHLSVTAALTPTIIPAVPGYIDAAIFVSGAASGDTVTIGGPPNQAGVILTAFVAGVNQVNVRWAQISGAAVTPTAGTYRVDVWKH